MKSFSDLSNNYHCRPIANCPGRFIIADTTQIPLTTLLEIDSAIIKEYLSRFARDTVLVVKLDQGGLISYCRNDGSYLHTLNTDEGFQRKLVHLGINHEGHEVEESS